MTRASLSSPRLLAVLVLLIPLIMPLKQAIAADSDERWYQVELIIFENKDVDSGTETWSNDPGKPDLGNAIELHKEQPMVVQTEPSPTDPDAVQNTDVTATTPTPLSTAAETGTPEAPGEQPFTLLPEDQLAMNDIVKRLDDDSRDYHPLLHIGWRQPVPERDNGQPILIDSRKLLLYTARIANDDQTMAPGQAVNDGSSASAGPDLSAPPNLDNQGPDEIVTTINENFVSGTLTLTRGRYLHMGLDLIYERQPNSPQLFSFFGFGNAEDVPEIYRLMQSRRLRRGEIHYFDHPKFGVLAMVTAVEINSDEDEEDGSAQTIPLKPLR